MTPYYESSDVTIYCADSRTAWRDLPEHSVDAIVTSPPYWGLRDYGHDGQLGLEDDPSDYIAELADLLTGYGERVLKPGGSLWLNLGDTYNGAATGNTSGRGASSTLEGTPNTGDDPGDFHKPEARGFPRKCLLMIPERVALALIERGWILRNRVVWCLAGNTRIYARTQKGEGPHTLRDLARLAPSTVQLWNGDRWTQVLRWTRTEGDQAYRVTFADGHRVLCTGEHLWPTQRGDVRADDLATGDVVPTVRLPEPRRDEPAMLPDEIGWLIGLYVAEGSPTADGRGIQIASHVAEAERHKRLEDIADALDGTCSMYRTGGNAATINLYGPAVVGAIRSYVAGSGAKGKRLTGRSWRRSDRFLAAVLQGYLDGDGHWDENADRWRIAFTDNPAWADDLRTLAARLGRSLHLVKAVHRLGEQWFPGYRGDLRHDPARRVKPGGYVVSVEPSRGSTFWDVTVEDEPHLFALASGHLTHNCKPNGMPSSVQDRLATKHEALFHLVRQPKYFYDLDAIREPHAEASLKRVEYGLKHRHPDGVGVAIPPVDVERMGERFAHPGGKNPGDVWTISTQPYPDAHFAVFPPDLVRRPILATVPENGTVLDPFFGSGTTAVMARRLGRKTVGVELSDDYCKLAAARFRQQTFDLTGGAA